MGGRGMYRGRREGTLGERDNWERVTKALIKVP